METFEREISNWFSKSALEGGRMETAVYGDCMVMVRMEGECFSLPDGWPGARWHLFLLLFSGELRLTVGDEPMCFEMPLYMDCCVWGHWHSVSIRKGFRACFFIVSQDFFLESVVSLRPKIAGAMMHFTRCPFIPLSAEDSGRFSHLADLLFASLSGGEQALRRDMVLALLRAAQCELWNAVYRRQDMSVSSGGHWNDVASHFLYLAHRHSRKRYEVAWYARQLGVSPDALSFMLKRLYGKTATVILDEILVNEAKVCLRNPALSVQNVADMLCFSDQSAFGKFFKRHCGMSPNAFRQRMRDDERKENVAEK